MTIIVFLVDTSASMNQRTYLGARLTVLDVAKDAVERFIKIRQRDSASRGDRYMLLTFEEPPTNIKAGWKENHATFMTELKNLHAIGLTTIGGALKNAFDLLNVNRMQTGIDTYGQGRCPYYLEPSIIIVITDGNRLTSSSGVQEELNLPMHSSVPGSELTKEPFRWDQRIFALVLRMAGTQPVEREPNSVVLPDNSPIDDMCEVTGGRSFCVTSHRVLMQCLESLVQKVQGGVVINFEKVGPDPQPVNNEDTGTDEKTGDNSNSPPPVSSAAWQNCRKLIYVQRSAQKGYSVGHWPIPESFWPDLNSPSLPPRSAHPNLKFTCHDSDPVIIDNLPFDKYELEPSPLTQFILSRKLPMVSWQVFISNSHKSSELGHAFGYLKASTNLSCVNLFVLPYNYPQLLPLLDDLFKVHRCKPTREWKQQFDNYLKNMPLYYAVPLKRALQRMGAPNLVPETMENCLSYSILNYLKRLKNQAKAEFDKLISTVGVGKSIQPEGLRVNPGILKASGSISKLSEMNLSSNPVLNERFKNLKQELNDFSGFLLAVRGRDVKTDTFRNPFDILRDSLLDQIARMRANYLQIGPVKFQDDDSLHSLPVSQMGNYQEYLKRMPTPLREIESTPVRQHMFGNPFKIEKRMMVDEADIDLVGGAGAAQMRGTKRPSELPAGPRPKRKPGPLPRDLSLKRPVSPFPPASPGSPTDDIPILNKENVENEPIEPRLLPNRSTVNHEMPYSWPTVNENSLPPVNRVVENHIDSWGEPPTENLHSHHNGPVERGNNVWAENNRIKRLLMKEVRRPGRNFEKLFEHLQTVQGGLETRILMVRQVIHEAGRFKRHTLIQLLEEYEQRIMDAAAFQR